MRVAVLYGGNTAEREISLQSGQAVAEALRDGGHEVVELELGDPAAILPGPDVASADVVFPVLHGGYGEDGRVQAMLELLHKPYVGSRPAACAVAMDKIWSKQVAREIGVPTADWREVAPGDDADSVVAAAETLGWPVVFKPVLEGSAVGVHIPSDAAALRAVLAEAGERRTPWMLEAFIEGRELTVPWLWGETYPLVEIRPKQGFYDYRNKYTKGASEYLCPAPLDEATAALVSHHAASLARALRLRDMARIDVRLHADRGPFLLEANTIPGMTGLSLLPMGAKARGIDYVSLCDRLVTTAAHRGADILDRSQGDPA